MRSISAAGACRGRPRNEFNRVSTRLPGGDGPGPRSFRHLCDIGQPRELGGGSNRAACGLRALPDPFAAERPAGDTDRAGAFRRRRHRRCALGQARPGCRLEGLGPRYPDHSFVVSPGDSPKSGRWRGCDHACGSLPRRAAQTGASRDGPEPRAPAHPHPEGLFRIGSSHLYVRGKVGTTFTPVRLYAPPEITLLCLS